MSVPNIIAIDGPAASGKSSIGKRLADHLGYLFFDTGVMYRAVTWAALEQGIDLENGGKALAHLAEHILIDVRPASKDDGRSSDVLVDGRDITWEIRTSEVDQNVSVVSAYPKVRQALTSQQRRVGLRGKVVMVGRDIGTVVLPEAGLKIYLDATVEERARRRHLEQLERGEDGDFQEILAAMRKRDEIDSTRQVAPLKPAEDAIILETDQLSEDQVFAEVKSFLRQNAIQA